MTTCTSGYEDRHTANAFLSLRSRQITRTSSSPLLVVATIGNIELVDSLFKIAVPDIILSRSVAFYLVVSG